MDDPSGQISHETVFEDHITATAATTTMYAKLRDEVLITGNFSGLGAQMGLYSDELDYYGAPGQPIATFYNHQILASNVLVLRTWNSAYNLVYMANTNIEGLEASQALSQDLKNQLLGEALFIRALTHFYLVNLYGEIPYIKTTDYDKNRLVSKVPEHLVYEYIIADLLEAKNRIGENYMSSERIRANKYVVSALLARVYVYTSQWENAENESSSLINNTSLYNLEIDLENVFLKTSPAAILQLKTKVTNQSTTEANSFVFTSGPPPSVALNPNYVNSMEANDLRRLHWVGKVTNNSNTWYFSNKYRQGTNLQYSTIFRLAEQYLIRAEARTRLNDISGAQNDINSIRQRAGLSQTEAHTRDELLQAILKERQSELFAEHGHRWFDIRRFGMANDILTPIKTSWQTTDIFLPIPETELLMNSNLNPQNPGY
ncbi:RagB/SusD family nutrient uptake outer membrane protein [Gelidibacter gilvus]|uniref:RagB/SusD family nutrient uptake outer membrane protein n=1 Tax=Gelidibacter maritimus TaxID=2761487 RepID=A0A7W2M4Q2_9FLAO|nr:RagB/SusD family nutrient uptake outer membrane protein [Gelidibacter maritimus]